MRHTHTTREFPNLRNQVIYGEPSLEASLLLLRAPSYVKRRAFDFQNHILKCVPTAHVLLLPPGVLHDHSEPPPLLLRADVPRPFGAVVGGGGRGGIGQPQVGVQGDLEKLKY